MNGIMTPAFVPVDSELMKSFTPDVKETVASGLFQPAPKTRRFTMAELTNIERRRRKATKLRRVIAR